MADWQSRDPLCPGFWDERFERGFTPWERGAAPEALRAFVAGRERPLSCLIPGCGSAWELALMAEAGWDARAIDFSPVAVARARRQLPAWSGRIAQADFFGPEAGRGMAGWEMAGWEMTGWEMIYERAFLCALPRQMWPRVAARWAGLLAPSGIVAGYFYLDDNPKGPPFGIARSALEALMAPYFDCLDEQPVADSIAIFAGKERWMVWSRRD